MKSRREEEGIRAKKNWFLVCFFPVDADSVTGKKKPIGRINSDRRDPDPLLTYSYISVTQKELLPAVIISSKSGIEEACREDTLKRHQKSDGRLLTPIDNLTEKVRTGKSRQEPNQSSIISKKNEQPAIPLPETKRKREYNRKIDKISSSSRCHFDSVPPSSLSLIGSKISSSKSSSSRRNSKSIPAIVGESKQSDCSRKTFNMPQKFLPVTGLYLLLIGLLIMLLWGRVCAIICTSTWLYLVTRRVTLNHVPEIDDESPEDGTRTVVGNLQTSESKKKVIMDGFMERNKRV